MTEDKSFFKTETMICNWNVSSDGTDPESIIKVQNVKLINYEYFKYSSVWISYNSL